MATDNLYGVVLGDVSDSAASRVTVEPAGSSGLATAIGSITDGLKAVTGRWESQAQRRNQERIAARQAEQDRLETIKRERGTQEESALSDVAIGLNLVNTGSYTDQFGELQPPENLGADMNSAVRKIGSVDAAVNQGRMPSISRESAVNGLFQNLVAKYGPSYAATIAKGFRDNGVGNALTHEIAAEIDAVDAKRKSEAEFGTKMIEVTRSNLDPATAGGMTETELVNWGINYTRRNNELDLIQKQANLTQTQNSTAQNAYNFDKTVQGDEYTNAVVQQVTGSLEPIARAMQGVVMAMPEVGKDPALEVRLADLANKARTTATNLINAQIARGGYPTIEAANKAREALMNYVETTLIAPYEGRDKSFAQATDSVVKHLGLEARLSAPLIQDLKTKFGLNASDIPELMNSVPPELIQGLKRELSGIARPGINENIATIQLGNIVSVLRGEKNLSYIDTPRERQQIVATTNNIVRNGAAAVAAGRGNPEQWGNAARQLIIATQGVSRQTPPATLRTITTSLLSPESIGAINKMMTGPDAEEAKVLGSSARAAAVLVLQSAKANIKGSISPATPWVVGVDEAGYLRAQPNRKWKAPQALPGDRSTGFSNGGTVSRPALDPQLKTLVDVANANLNYLQQTAGWDGDAPKGTPIEVRRFWSTGALTPDMQRAAQQGKREKGSVSSAMDALDRSLSDVPSTLSSGGGSSRGERNNNPGNLEDGAFARSQPGYTGSDGRFAQFATPAHGERAQETLLKTSYIGKGLNTVTSILEKYAPPTTKGGDNELAAWNNYRAYVARRAGVDPNSPIPDSKVGLVAQAMREFETGNTRG